MSTTKKMTPSEVIENRLNSLTGEILTIIEAVVPATDAELNVFNFSGTSNHPAGMARANTQREAVKSLVKSSFSRAHQDMQDWIK